MLLRDALRGRRDKVFLAVKFGALRGPDGAFLAYDARPAAIKNFVAYSLTRLGTDYIDLYQPARIDPDVPVEDTVGAIADLVRAGYVRHIGLSEASPATVARAQKVHPIAALQIEYSLVCRGIEREIIPAMRRLGVAVNPYAVLCRGLLSGEIRSRPIFARDSRLRQPRFNPENLTQNLALVDRLGGIAREMGRTPSQLALAWVLAQGGDIVPLIGVKRRTNLAALLPALEMTLGAKDRQRMELAVPAAQIAGDRYGTAELHVLDSEQKGGG